MQDLKAVCHVCEALFTLCQVHFLSAPSSRRMPDGTERLLLTCNVAQGHVDDNKPVIGSFTPHTRAEIRASWERRHRVS